MNPIDKASNNFYFICTKFYVSKLVDEVGLRVTQSNTSKLLSKLKEQVFANNVTLSSKFDFWGLELF